MARIKTLDGKNWSGKCHQVLLMDFFFLKSKPRLISTISLLENIMPCAAKQFITVRKRSTRINMWWLFKETSFQNWKPLLASSSVSIQAKPPQMLWFNCVQYSTELSLHMPQKAAIKGALLGTDWIDIRDRAVGDAAWRCWFMETRNQRPSVPCLHTEPWPLCSPDIHI